jgi:hypothetical protein
MATVADAFATREAGFDRNARDAFEDDRARSPSSKRGNASDEASAFATPRAGLARLEIPDPCDVFPAVAAQADAYGDTARGAVEEALRLQNLERFIRRLDLRDAAVARNERSHTVTGARRHSVCGTGVTRSRVIGDATRRKREIITNWGKPYDGGPDEDVVRGVGTPKGCRVTATASVFDAHRKTPFDRLAGGGTARGDGGYAFKDRSSIIELGVSPRGCPDSARAMLDVIAPPSPRLERTEGWDLRGKSPPDAADAAAGKGKGRTASERTRWVSTGMETMEASARSAIDAYVASSPRSPRTSVGAARFPPLPSPRASASPTSRLSPRRLSVDVEGGGPRAPTEDAGWAAGTEEEEEEEEEEEDGETGTGTGTSGDPGTPGSAGTVSDALRAAGRTVRLLSLAERKALFEAAVEESVAALSDQLFGGDGGELPRVNIEVVL